MLAAELRAAGSPVGATALMPGFVRSNIRSSLRNRPGAGVTGLRDVDLAASGRDLRWLDPDDVGAMVLDAVRGNELYLSTHPDLLGPIADRHARIQAGFADFP